MHLKKSGYCIISGNEVYATRRNTICEIYNNTFAENDWDGIENDVVKNLTIINNIFDNARYEIHFRKNSIREHAIDYNLYSTDSEWKAFGKIYNSLSSWKTSIDQDMDRRSIVSEPLFIDETHSNYLIHAKSEARDAGKNLSTQGITDDIKGVLRPHGQGCLY